MHSITTTTKKVRPERCGRSTRSRVSRGGVGGGSVQPPFHPVAAQWAPAQVDEPDPGLAKTQGLEEGSGADARLGRELAHAPAPGRLHEAPDQGAADPAALASVMDIEEVDDPRRRQAGETDQLALADRGEGLLAREPTAPEGRWADPRRPGTALGRAIVAAVDPPHRLVEEPRERWEIAAVERADGEFAHEVAAEQTGFTRLGHGVQGRDCCSSVVILQ
jgi:hypothetical protein